MVEDTALLPAGDLYVAFSGRVRPVLLFFIRFAWFSKIRIPILLTVASMAFDVRVRLEVIGPQLF